MSGGYLRLRGVEANSMGEVADDGVDALWPEFLAGMSPAEDHGGARAKLQGKILHNMRKVRKEG